MVGSFDGEGVGSSVVGSLEGAAVLLEDPVLIDAMGDSVRTPVGEYVSSEGVTYVGTTVASDASLVTVGEDVAGVRVEGGKVGGIIGV